MSSCFFFVFVFVCAAQKVQKRFTNNRTDHFKLCNAHKQGKSGAGAKRMTPLQKFKLEAYTFLQSFYKPRTASQTMGRVSILQD